MKIYESVTQLIGKTPLIKLNGLIKHHNLKANLIAKVEAFNPAGSVKDRIAYAMISKALLDNKINKDTVIIEPTSGNTGIGLAQVCSALSLKLIIVMPDSMSIERRNLLRAFGAKVVLTQGSLGMNGAIQKAKELLFENKNSYMPSQFMNHVNPEAHYSTTGPEIYEDTDGKVDYLVAGIGTGGTISGAGRYLKEKIKSVKVIGVEPAQSPVLTKGFAGNHAIQGIGAGFIPDTLDKTVLDEVIAVDNVDAFTYTNQVAQLDGILAGISSGAAIAAAIELAKRIENFGRNIVVILPDTGERYLSTPVFLK